MEPHLPILNITNGIVLAIGNFYSESRASRIPSASGPGSARQSRISILLPTAPSVEFARGTWPFLSSLNGYAP